MKEREEYHNKRSKTEGGGRRCKGKNRENVKRFERLEEIKKIEWDRRERGNIVGREREDEKGDLEK